MLCYFVLDLINILIYYTIMWSSRPLYLNPGSAPATKEAGGHGCDGEGRVQVQVQSPMTWHSVAVKDLLDFVVHAEAEGLWLRCRRSCFRRSPSGPYFRARRFPIRPSRPQRICLDCRPTRRWRPGGGSDDSISQHNMRVRVFLERGWGEKVYSSRPETIKYQQADPRDKPS